MLASCRLYARQIKSEVYAIYLACRDPRTPWYAKMLAACVTGYAFSPVDLIPDFIPVLGYLDDLLLVPLGIALVRKLIPPDVLAECRRKARQFQDMPRPTSRAAAAAIIAVWTIVLALTAVLIYRYLSH
jgi:uncharacterized membrane protein YkvA (DUF1232 family)